MRKKNSNQKFQHAILMKNWNPSIRKFFAQSIENEKSQLVAELELSAASDPETAGRQSTETTTFNLIINFIIINIS